MKLYPGRDRLRVFYEDREIEDRVELELRRSGLMPTLERPVTDLERFIERHLDARLEEFTDLDPEVLGMTSFGDQPFRVYINRELTERADQPGSPAGLRGRRRATLAHEASHILLHACLFRESPGQGLLFPETESERAPSLLRCLKREVNLEQPGQLASDWREVQANKGMAALLMPRTLFREVAILVMGEHGWTDEDLQAPSPPEAFLTAELARRFEVSRQACRIRLHTLDLVHSGRPPGLPFD